MGYCWRLTAKENVTSPEKFYNNPKARDLKKGFSFIVASSSTGTPSHDDVRAALVIHGFCKEEAFHYDNSSWEYYFEGQKIGEDGWSERHAEQVNILRNMDAYSERKRQSEVDENNKKLKAAEQEAHREEPKKESNDKEGCLTKIIKAPFRFLWWLIKFIFKIALSILTLGLVNSWFNGDKDK